MSNLNSASREAGSSPHPDQRDWLFCFTDTTNIKFDRAVNASGVPIGDLDHITHRVSRITGVSRPDLRGRSRKRSVAWPRQAIYFIATERGKSSVQIGKWFKRDHATVLEGVKAVKKRLSEGCQETARIIAEAG